MARFLITTYQGYNILYNDELKKYLVDTGAAIYFRNTLSEIEFLIDNLRGVNYDR